MFQTTNLCGPQVSKYAPTKVVNQFVNSDIFVEKFNILAFLTSISDACTVDVKIWNNPNCLGSQNQGKGWNKCQKCNNSRFVKKIREIPALRKTLELIEIEVNRWADSFFCFIVNQSMNNNAIKIHTLTAPICYHIYFQVGSKNMAISQPNVQKSENIGTLLA